MASVKDADYCEQLVHGIQIWCWTLVKKGRSEFLQLECLEKFVVAEESKVLEACKQLCIDKKLSIEITFSGDTLYKLGVCLIEEAELKISQGVPLFAGDEQGVADGGSEHESDDSYLWYEIVSCADLLPPSWYNGQPVEGAEMSGVLSRDEAEHEKTCQLVADTPIVQYGLYQRRISQFMKD